MSNYFFILILLLPITLLAQHSAYESFEAANALYDLRDYQGASDQYEHAKQLYEAQNNWDTVALCMINIGYALFGQRDYQAASTYMGISVKQLEKYEGLDAFLLAKCYSFSAFLGVVQKNYGQALALYHQAITIYEKNKINHHNVAYAYKGAAQIYMRRLDYPNVSDCLHKALICDSTQTYTSLLQQYFMNITNEF